MTPAERDCLNPAGGAVATLLLVTREEALRLLECGNFEPFVGVREDLELEFKRQPYGVDGEPQKFELTNDAAALANAAGGVIVIGVITERRERSPLDEAVRIRPLTKGLVDTGRYEALIGERGVPTDPGPPRRVQPSAVDVDRGLVVIDVPAQAATDKLGQGRRSGSRQRAELAETRRVADAAANGTGMLRAELPEAAAVWAATDGAEDELSERLAREQGITALPGRHFAAERPHLRIPFGGRRAREDLLRQSSCFAMMVLSV